MSEIRTALERCASWKQERAAAGTRLRLACKLGAPLRKGEVAAAWPVRSLHPDLFELWMTCGEAELFIDVERGRWGLKILSPTDAAERTEFERRERPTDLEPGDVVLGELQDAEGLLVVTASGGVFVALPLDYRSDWRRAGDNLGQFLARYVESEGRRFWDRA